MMFYESAPRGLPTYELLGLVRVFDPNEPIDQKGFNPKLATIIANQVLRGIFNLEQIKSIAPKANLDLFNEVPCDYGPRVGNQLEQVIKCLLEDPDSRRAIITLTRPDDDPPPCIMTIQFLLRQGRVHLIACMRSWDLTLGLGYDLVIFRTLLLEVADSLRMGVGGVTVFAGSGHIYNKCNPRR